MIEDANTSIRRANEEASRRRTALISRRRPLRQLDHWLSQVETLLERNEPVVPEPLISEIAGFLGKLDPRLYRRLRRDRRRKASRVLDLLFEVEELFLPRAADMA
jgi:hypothetical protein